MRLWHGPNISGGRTRDCIEKTWLKFEFECMKIKEYCKMMNCACLLYRLYCSQCVRIRNCLSNLTSETVHKPCTLWQSYKLYSKADTRWRRCFRQLAYNIELLSQLRRINWYTFYITRVSTAEDQRNTEGFWRRTACRLLSGCWFHFAEVAIRLIFCRFSSGARLRGARLWISIGLQSWLIDWFTSVSAR